MSWKVAATVCSSASGRRARRPGVSMMQAPPGSWNSERAVVVCLPRLSCSRTAPVSCAARPSRVLVRVDLPAPDEPSSTRVCPARVCGAKRSAVSGSRASTLNDSSCGSIHEGRRWRSNC